MCTEIYLIAKGHSSDPFLVYTLPTSEPYGLECGGLEGQLLSFNWQWPQKGIQKGTYNFHINGLKVCVSLSKCHSCSLPIRKTHSLL